MRKAILILSVGALVLGIFVFGFFMASNQAFCHLAKAGHDSGTITTTIAKGMCSDHGFETLFGAEGSVKANAAKRELCRKALSAYKKSKVSQSVVELVCFDIYDDFSISCADIESAHNQGLISMTEKKEHCN